MNNPSRLGRFLDEQERVAIWPSKLKDKLVVLDYLASQFETQRFYTETEVNALLNRLHTFGDCALLRRALYDYAFIDRTRDGSSYWRIDPLLSKRGEHQ